MGALALRTARRAKVPGNLPNMYLVGDNCYTHQALNLSSRLNTIHGTSLFVLFFIHLLITSCHMRKDTRLSLLFHTVSNKRLGWAWEQGYELTELLVRHSRFSSRLGRMWRYQQTQKHKLQSSERHRTYGKDFQVF